MTKTKKTTKTAEKKYVIQNEAGLYWSERDPGSWQELLQATRYTRPRLNSTMNAPPNYQPFTWCTVEKKQVGPGKKLITTKPCKAAEKKSGETPEPEKWWVMARSEGSVERYWNVIRQMWLGLRDASVFTDEQRTTTRNQPYSRWLLLVGKQRKLLEPRMNLQSEPNNNSALWVINNVQLFQQHNPEQFWSEVMQGWTTLKDCTVFKKPEHNDLPAGGSWLMIDPPWKTWCERGVDIRNPPRSRYADEDAERDSQLRTFTTPEDLRDNSKRFQDIARNEQNARVAVEAALKTKDAKIAELTRELSDSRAQLERLNPIRFSLFNALSVKDDPKNFWFVMGQLERELTSYHEWQHSREEQVWMVKAPSHDPDDGTPFMDEEGYPLYWSSSHGWTRKANADTFTRNQCSETTPPAGGTWELQ